MLNLGFLSNIMGKEKFENFRRQESFPLMLALVLAAYICVSGILLRFLWNNYVVKLAADLKPISGFLDAIFLKLFVTILLH